MALPVTLVTLGGMPVELVDQTGSVFPTTGTGSLVFNTTPTLITPILGAATGTSLALGGAALVGNALAVTGTTSLSNGTATFDAVGNAVMASANIGSYVSIHFGVAGQILTRSTGLYAFSANATITGGGDTALSRISAGIIGVGTGAAGNVAGGLQAATLALGGATIGTHALAVTGTASFSVQVAVPFVSTGSSGGSKTVFQMTSNGSHYGGIQVEATAGTGAWSLSYNVLATSVLGTPALTWNGSGLVTIPTALAIGGATIGTNALAVTGVTQFNSNVWVDAAVGFGVGGVRGNISAPSDGVFLLRNTSGTDFNRLQFGGITSSFPAIARSGTTLKFRTADDLNDAPITAATLTLGDGAVSAQSVVIGDAGGWFRSATGVLSYGVASSVRFSLYSGGTVLPNTLSHSFLSGASGTSLDTRLFRVAANVLGYSDSAQTTGFSLSGTTADTLTVRNLGNSAAGALVAGTATFSGSVITTGNYQFGTNQTVVEKGTNGALKIRNYGDTAGGIIDAATDGTFKFFGRDGTTPAPIQIGNTVNSVSPTSPNRTVTMVIGGTTYYLAAKTTND